MDRNLSFSFLPHPGTRAGCRMGRWPAWHQSKGVNFSVQVSLALNEEGPLGLLIDEPRETLQLPPLTTMHQKRSSSAHGCRCLSVGSFSCCYLRRELLLLCFCLRLHRVCGHENVCMCACAYSTCVPVCVPWKSFFTLCETWLCFASACCGCRNTQPFARPTPRDCFRPGSQRISALEQLRARAALEA